MTNYKKILIHNNKGGVGKTLFTANLAVYLAKKGHKILLIDFDRQRSLTDKFIKTDKWESFNIFNNNKAEILATTINNIWILPGDKNPEPNINFEKMEAKLKVFEKEHFSNFDYIFYDLHSAMTNLNTVVYKIVDTIILISDSSLNSATLTIDAFNDWEWTCLEIERKNNIKGILFNRDHEGKEASLSKNNLQEMLGNINFKTIIPDWLIIAKSVNNEEPWMTENVKTNVILIALEKELIERGIL